MKFLKIKINVFISGVLLLLSLQINAQQHPKYTQYMYNTSVFNPAYIASQDDISIFGLYSSRFVGVQGAPKLANISFSLPISNNGLYLGANLTHDSAGAIDENNIAVNTGYKVKLNQDYQLAFALKGSINLLSIDYTKLSIHDSDDPMIDANINNKISSNIGAGIFAFSDKAYLGISIPYFLENKISNENGDNIMSKKLHFYLMGGYIFDVSSNILLKPAFLVSSQQEGSTQLDITLNANFNDIFTLGVSYSSQSSISLLAGFEIQKSLFMGYGISKQTNSFKQVNSLSHELFIRYNLPNWSRKSKMSAPRFF